MAVLDWIMILAYFGVLGGVVWWSMRRNKIESEEDLFLGGRSVGWLAIGASIFAANIGSEHLIGLAGSGAVAGLSQSSRRTSSRRSPSRCSPARSSSR